MEPDTPYPTECGAFRVGRVGSTGSRVIRAVLTWLSLVIAVVCLLQTGCEGNTGGSRGEGQREGTPDTIASPPDRVARGKEIAEANLGPVGGSDVHAKAVLSSIGKTGVEVDLDVRGLPTKDPNAVYYAQVHEGSCSAEGKRRKHEKAEQRIFSPGPSLTLVRFGSVLSKSTGLQAHGGHEDGVPEVPPGSIEQPVTIMASADGTASVISLLEAVEPKRLTSGRSEYIHLHAASGEDTPQEELACGDLVVANRLATG
jgi:hypothetical protein